MIKKAMNEPTGKYNKFLRRLQEELDDDRSDPAFCGMALWQLDRPPAAAVVHERLLRDVRKNLQGLNQQVMQEPPEFRRAFGAEFQRWALSLPGPAREQLELLKEYTAVFAEPKRS